MQPNERRFTELQAQQSVLTSAQLRRVLASGARDPQVDARIAANSAAIAALLKTR